MLCDAICVVRDFLSSCVFRACDYLYRLWYAMRAFCHLVRYRAEICAVHPLINCAPITSPSGLAPALVYCLIVRIPLASWQRVDGASMEKVNVDGFDSLAEATIAADRLKTIADHSAAGCRVAAYDYDIETIARQVA